MPSHSLGLNETWPTEVAEVVEGNVGLVLDGEPNLSGSRVGKRCRMSRIALRILEGATQPL